MATLPEALDDAFARRFRIAEVRTPATQRRGLVARMNALVKLHGGDYKRAAASAGIPERTWRDWRSGTHPPSPRSLRRLEGAYARQIVAPAVARIVTTGKKTVTDIHVQAVVVCDPGGDRYKNSEAYRWFRAEDINAGKVVNAWMHQGGEAAASVFEAEVERRYGSVFAFEGSNVGVNLLPRPHR